MPAVVEFRELGVQDPRQHGLFVGAKRWVMLAAMGCVLPAPAPSQRFAGDTSHRSQLLRKGLQHLHSVSRSQLPSTSATRGLCTVRARSDSHSASEQTAEVALPLPPPDRHLGHDPSYARGLHDLASQQGAHRKDMYRGTFCPRSAHADIMRVHAAAAFQSSQRRQ